MITSSIAVASCAEPVLIPSTASVDKGLTQHGTGVVVVTREVSKAHTRLWWEAADVQTSSTGARYGTTAGTCTVGVRGKCIFNVRRNMARGYNSIILQCMYKFTKITKITQLIKGICELYSVGY